VRVRVEGSTHVEWIEWDAATRVLQVEYRGGKLYRYLEVPYEKWARLQRAPSKGSFLRREIQPHHATAAVGG
jgi:hypothetical protein